MHGRKNIKIHKFVLDNVIDLVGKVERRQRQTCITQKVTNKGWKEEVEECEHRRKKEGRTTEN